MHVISGKFQISDYSPNGDRIWVEVNGGSVTLQRGWSPSASNPLRKLGDLPDATRMDVLKKLEEIGKIISDAHANWQV